MSGHPGPPQRRAKATGGPAADLAHEQEKKMTGLDFVLDRSLTIVAKRETVFRYFTDSERFAAWWGPGSTIDPGRAAPSTSAIPNAIVAGGESWRSSPPERIVFSYGFESGQPIPLGASRVTITLVPKPAAGTLLRAASRAAERRGARRARAGLALPARALRQRGGARPSTARRRALVDRFFACWAEPDAGEAPRRARRGRSRGPLELPRPPLLHLKASTT